MPFPGVQFLGLTGWDEVPFPAELAPAPHRPSLTAASHLAVFSVPTKSSTNPGLTYNLGQSVQATKAVHTSKLLTTLPISKVWFLEWRGWTTHGLCTNHYPDVPERGRFSGSKPPWALLECSNAVPCVYISVYIDTGVQLCLQNLNCQRQQQMLENVFLGLFKYSCKTSHSHRKTWTCHSTWTGLSHQETAEELCVPSYPISAAAPNRPRLTHVAEAGQGAGGGWGGCLAFVRPELCISISRADLSYISQALEALRGNPLLQI